MKHAPQSVDKEKIHYLIDQCSVGLFLAAESGHGICAVALGDSAEPLRQELKDNFPDADLIEESDRLKTKAAIVRAAIDAQEAAPAGLTLDLRGTDFQKQVWQALTGIPRGKTLSYLDIAHAVHSPKSVRAVGSACGANKIAVLVPCHRVLRGDGNISGYRWGVERKRELLKKELN